MSKSLAFLIALISATSVSAQSNNDYAPPVIEVDGLRGIPIDILSVDSQMVFDFASKSVSVISDMNFKMIGEKGFPLFDLRQEITSASLNGEDIDIAKLAAHDFGKGAGTMRIIESECAMKVVNVLHLEYTLSKPSSPAAIDIKWDKAGMTFDTWYSDLNPGRYAEQWFPANLLYDQHPLNVDLKLVGAESEHLMITNGATTVVAKHDWQLRFPETSTAFSHMIVVVPASEVDFLSEKGDVNGEEMRIDVYCRKDAPTSAVHVLNETAISLRKYSESMGKWDHGNDCIVYVWKGNRSMEYDGATTTALGALDHEIFHSWFGRGVKPASQNDGWWDEAFNVYFADGRRPNKRVVQKEGKPVTLSSSNPYNRITPGTSYSLGAVFFGRLAYLLGADELHQHMSDFYKKYTGHVASTADMENFLVAESGNEEVRKLFARYVYGRGE
ncbi:MAG: hypothetical protein HOD03_02640 [Planctomycetes bacterium]|jgi:hypothetical protein|nr:hypothetical protein [Planctomycetota bacterium]